MDTKNHHGNDSDSNSGCIGVMACIILVSLIGILGFRQAIIVLIVCTILCVALYLFLSTYFDKKREERLEQLRKSAELESERKSIELNHKRIAVEGEINTLLEKHRSALITERSKLIKIDAYGIVDESRWKEYGINYFIENVLYPQLSIVSQVNLYLVDDRQIINQFVTKSINDFNNSALQTYSDNFTGVEYEQYCISILILHGWQTRMTPATADQGVDILAEKNNIRVAIQCKKQINPVGNAAVQQAYAGSKYYFTDYAVVVTNNTYTSSAKQLADSLKVKLLHHIHLSDNDFYKP